MDELIRSFTFEDRLKLEKIIGKKNLNQEDKEFMKRIDMVLDHYLSAKYGYIPTLALGMFVTMIGFNFQNVSIARMFFTGGITFILFSYLGYKRKRAFENHFKSIGAVEVIDKYIFMKKGGK